MCGNSSELYSIIFSRWGKVCSLILKSSSFIKQVGSMVGVLVRLLTVLKSVVSSAYDIKVKA